MRHTALGLTLAALCALPCPDGVAADKPDRAEPLRRLRQPAHEWLGRDIGEKTCGANRAYADLILAFGLARAGDPDGAKVLLKEATGVLEKGDAAHRCLLALYRHRIEQVLASEPSVGPLPARLLAGVTPTGKEPVNSPVKLHHLIVLRARELSRIIDPLEQVEPYLPWTAGGAGDPLVGRLAPLQDEQNPERFARDARTLLTDAGTGSLEARLRVTTQILGLAPRAGDAFAADSLKAVPALIREGRAADGELARAGTVALAEQALTLAAGLKKPELFGPLAAEAAELVKAESAASAPGVIARLTVGCACGCRVMGLRYEARTFLAGAAGRLPEAVDTKALQDAAGKDWPDAARTRLAEAGLRRSAGEDAEAGKIFTLVRDVVLDPPAGDRGVPYYRLVAE